MGIAALDKPAGAWCRHCQPDRGCAIYDQRPDECRDFVCGWLRMPQLDERWKPSTCKFVLATDDARTHMKIVVDAARPDAWRKEPYYSTFRAWAQAGPEQGMKIMVAIGSRAIVILPDREVDLGILGTNERVVTVRSETAFGARFEVLKLHKDDPRLHGAAVDDFGTPLPQEKNSES
jgi:hypothetical protein